MQRSTVLSNVKGKFANIVCQCSFFVDYANDFTIDNLYDLVEAISLPLNKQTGTTAR